MGTARCLSRVFCKLPIQILWFRLQELSFSPSFVFAFLNSCYSFYWDVAKDWDFTLFSSQRLDRDHPYGLRRHRYFSSDRLYHYVIIADLVLRFSWLWRVLPGFSWIPETESGVFMLMLLEVARRWMWVFFRIEAEWGMFHCNAPVPLFQPACREAGKASTRPHVLTYSSK